MAEVAALEDNVAGVGLVQAGQQVEQGGLAGTGTAGNGEELAGHDVQVNAVDGGNRLVAGAEDLDQAAGGNNAGGGDRGGGRLVGCLVRS